MEVSEAEIEACQNPSGTDGDSSGSAYGPAADTAASGGPQAPPRPSGAVPPPLPSRRRRLPRPKLAQIVGFLAICTVVGLGIGLLWNLAFAPEPEPAASASRAGPEQGEAEPAVDELEAAEVEIRLDEMVVTSEEQDQGDDPGAENGDAEQ